LADAAHPAQRDTLNGNRSELYDVVVSRNVDSGGRLDHRVVVPALHLPTSAALVVDEVDGIEPLGSFHSIVAWDEDPRRISVCFWQRRTVEVVGDQDLGRAVDEAEREALGIAVAGLECGPRAIRTRGCHREVGARPN